MFGFLYGNTSTIVNVDQMNGFKASMRSNNDSIDINLVKCPPNIDIFG
jgi:hypothetical protein